MTVSNCKKYISAFLSFIVFALVCGAKTMPVDYVNPYMGNISHLLMPTFPTVHLPNSMLRIYPQRGSATESLIDGLPIITVNHRECCAFNLSAIQSENPELRHVIKTDYDNESITPYSYCTEIDGQNIAVQYAPSHHSAIYDFAFRNSAPAYLILNASGGEIHIDNNTISGWQPTWGGVKIYIYAEVNCRPIREGVLIDGKISSNLTGQGNNACAVLQFDGIRNVSLRYGLSFISLQNAKDNLNKEISGFDIEKVKNNGRRIWNQELGKIKVEGGTDDDLKVFYTSLYRCMERPVDIAEYGQYLCPADRQVHDGTHFYTDDWLWDTYRATHPLRCLISPDQEVDMINSLILTAEHSDRQWFPTFPAVSGDSRRMNCNHGVAILADANSKGLTGFNLSKGYEYCKAAIEQKTLAPWSSRKAGYLNQFHEKHGYVPALRPGETEFSEEVDGWEKRQAVAVTLGTAYDNWCLAQIARSLGKNDEADKYLSKSYNYRNLYNSETGFFHPKDSAGVFIQPFDYRFSGGIGARDYYDENNGWTYRWDVQHNIPDLVELMGGSAKFVENLDATFNEWLGSSKWEFYSKLPDQTGNVGQFTMGNEPSMHIPYLYNYAGKPWKTQKRIRELVNLWFRNDLMGMPGDEDGGGLSSFVVFSMMGFYPVTPGKPIYDLGSPFFKKITITLGNGKKFIIEAPKCSDRNKYIKSAQLNGVKLSRPLFPHDAIKDGGRLVLEMTDMHQ